MPSLTIDGLEVTVPEGTSVLGAARKVGVEIPTFCEHPCLSIAGNCRMCLVEIDRSPRLAASCATPAVDGMVVRVNSQKAVDGRRSVIEFLLANHPSNCMICDKSGECVLQNNAVDHGKMGFHDKPERIRKSAMLDVGKHVMLNAEACIMCTRCVRFVDEITHTHELGIFGRGNSEEIGLAPGKRLDNAYSGCTVDVCPVGALTLKDFRFQSRVWFLERTESICPSCARGCNVTLEVNTDSINKTGSRRLYRIKPRRNDEVNQCWMCDEGRFRYRFVDEKRVTEPLRRESGRTEAVSWDEALATFRRYLMAAAPARIGVLLSRGSSLEDLYLARQFFTRHVPGAIVTTDVPAGRPMTEDDFLIHRDKWPNTAGAELLGFDGPGPKWVEVMDRAAHHELDLLIVVGHDLGEIFPLGEIDAVLHWPKHVVVLAQNVSGTVDRASLVLPVATFAEREGTWVNVDGRLQCFSAALNPLGSARPEWMVWREMLGRYGSPQLLNSARALFAAMAKRERSLAGISYDAIGSAGIALKIGSRGRS